MKLWRLIPALVLFFTAIANAPAAARTIGVVYDDSGSMAPSIHLPAFGVQLLIATLDGRAGHDRLFSIKLSSEPNTVREHDLRTGGLITREIDKVRNDWATAHGGTPYEPLELMLEKLVTETGNGEKAYLFVITDGAFGNPRDPRQLRPVYEAYKRRLKGQLEVLVLFIDRNDSEAAEARRQRVFETLLSVFDGKQETVNASDQLKDALVPFVARISETDPTRNNKIVRRDGNAVELDLPFSVTRIISLGVGSEQSPPPYLSKADFSAEALQFNPSMARGDTKFPTKLVGKVTQLRMEPALGTGKHRIEFSGRVGDETVVLFRSEIGVTWKLVDGSKELVPDARGAIEVSQGHKYKIVAQVRDRTGTSVISPGAIPGATVTATVIPPNGSSRTQTLTPSDNDKGFVGEIVFSAEGRHEVRTNLRVPGFVTDRADPVTVNVVINAFPLAMRLEPLEACPPGENCPSDVLPVRVHPANVPAGAVGRVEVTGTPPPGRAGQFRLEVSDWPAGFELVGPDRQPVKPDSRYSLSAGQSLRFDIVRPARWRPLLGSTSGAETKIKAVAVQPLEGEAMLAFRIRPNMPDPILNYRGHDQDRTGVQPLTLELPGAENALPAFDFYVENTLDLPTPRNISVNLSSGPAGFLTGSKLEIPAPREDGPSGYAFSVHPRLPWWCQCFLGLAIAAGMSPDAIVRVTYDPHDGRAPVSSEAPLRFTTQGWSPLSLRSGCLWLLLALAALAYLVRLLYALLVAHRFPASARFYVFDVGQTVPSVRRVRNSFWFDLRSALMLRIPRHRYRLDSLIVEAHGSQLRLRTGGHEWPSYYSVKHGKSLQEIAEQIAKRDNSVAGKTVTRPWDVIITISWNTMIEDPIPCNRRIVFVRDLKLRPDTARERECEPYGAVS